MRLILPFFLTLLCVSCYTSERNCGEFKTGTFEFEAITGTEVFTTRIVRNDSIEIEYYNDQVDTARIRWINDCEYILKKVNPKNMSERKAIHIKILKTIETGYSFEFNKVGKSAKSKASARKISDR